MLLPGGDFQSSNALQVAASQGQLSWHGSHRQLLDGSQAGNLNHRDYRRKAVVTVITEDDHVGMQTRQFCAMTGTHTSTADLANGGCGTCSC
jgi:hypothetical protein